MKVLWIIMIVIDFCFVVSHIIEGNGQAASLATAWMFIGLLMYEREGRLDG